MGNNTDYENDLILFTGAGVSIPVGIPGMYDFVEQFKESISKEVNALILLNKIINKEKIDLEELLGRLDKLSNLKEDETYLRMLDPDTEHMKTLANMGSLKELLLNFVYEKCSDFDKEKAKDVYKKFIDLKDLFVCKNLKIFTTNYDVCTETALEDQNPTTGFKTKGMYPTWDRSTFKDTSYKIQIYKLHGSITWYEYGDEIVQLPPVGRKLPTPRGKKFKVQMLYPISMKEVFKPPFSDLYYYLQKSLESCSVCIAIGYSFRDDSINSIFRNALNENKDLRLIIIDPNAEEIAKKFSSYHHKIVTINKKVERLDLKENEFLELIKKEAHKLRSKAFELRDSKKYKKGIEIGKRAVELALKIDDMKDAAFSYTAISDCYNRLNDKENTTKYSKKAIDLYEKIEPKTGWIYHSLGWAYGILNMKEKAIENFEKAIELYKKEDKTKEIEDIQRWISYVKKSE